MSKIIGFDIDEFCLGAFSIDNHLKNGSEFTNLCYDLLNSEFNKTLPITTLHRFSDNRPDGTIDMIADDPSKEHHKIFFQCKYLKNDKSIKTVINSIYNDLNKSLNNPEKPIPLTCQPWIGEKISKFVVCISSGLYPAQYLSIKEKLNDLFKEISKKEKLKHLENIGVEILFQDFFNNIIKTDRYYYNKWIRRSLVNLRILNKSFTQENKPINKFVDFLESKHLDYLSRTDYKKKLTSYDQKEFKDEDDLLNLLLSDHSHGLVIHGQGGVGKTRLMLELGSLLFSRKYTVIEVKKDFGNFDLLVELVASNGKYILLFDYIEEQKLFFKTANWIISESSKNVKIIANCRNSYLSEIQGSYFDYFKFFDVGLQNILEKNYKKEIILSIISSITDEKLRSQLKTDTALKSFYQEKPAYAAFIKYLHFKNKSEDFIIGGDDFSFWLIKRLKLTIVRDTEYKNFYEDKFHIFQIFACFPSDMNSTVKLKKAGNDGIKYRDEINKLQKDGWIDQTEDETLRVGHDAVSDALLISILNHYDFDDKIEEFLEFSFEVDSVSSMLYSIQRIWEFDVPDKKKLSMQKSIGRFLANTINETTSKLSWVKFRIDSTHLIEEGDRICLLIKNSHLLKETFSLEKFGHSLSFSMNWVSNAKIDVELKKKYSNWLKELYYEWRKNYKDRQYGNKVSLWGRLISTYINLFGRDNHINSIFHKYVQSVECRRKNLEFISYAIVSWLEHNGPLTPTLKDLLVSWFTIYSAELPSDTNPVFLLASWIKWGDDISQIYPFLDKSLADRNYNAQNKANLIVCWLENNCDPARVETFIPVCLVKEILPTTALVIIRLWLEKASNPLVVKALINKWIYCLDQPTLISIVIRRWLIAGDDPNILIKAIKNWTKTNHDEITTILRMFIEKKGNYHELEGEIINSLNANNDNIQSVYLLGKYLEVLTEGSIPLNVEKTAKDIIKNFAVVKETGYSIGYWVSKGGKLSVVRPYIKRWLSYNWEIEQSREIIFFWLINGGESTKIKPYLLLWLERFSEEIDTSPIVLCWLINGDDPLYIKDYIEKASEKWEQFEARYPITRWLEKTNLPNLVKKSTITWLSKFSDKPESIYVVASWIRYGSDLLLAQEYIENYFDKFSDSINSNIVIENWLNKDGDINVIAKHVEKNLNKEIDDKRTIFVANKWLKKQGDVNIVNYYVKNKLINYCQYRECDEVIATWLIRNGDPNIIKPVIIKYLEAFWEDIPANRLIVLWINYSSSIDGIEKYIEKIILTKRTNPFKQYLFIENQKIILNEAAIRKIDNLPLFLRTTSIEIKNHILSGHDIDEVKGTLTDTLDKYGLEINASYILVIWIELGNDFNFIRTFLMDWLDHNILDSYHSSYVLSAALEIEDGFELVHIEALKWLNYFHHLPLIKFPISSWLKLGNIKEKVKIEYWIDYWVENFYNANDHTWRDILIINNYKKRKTNSGDKKALKLFKGL